MATKRLKEKVTPELGPPLAREVVEAPRVEVMTKPNAYAALRRMEDRMLMQASEVVTWTMSFADVDPEATAPPPEWVEEVGHKEAVRRFRLAKYGMLSRGEAPIGIVTALEVHKSITRARSLEKAGPRILNMTMVQMPAAELNMPSLELEEGDR